MDIANILWLEADTADSYWEIYHRRSCTDGDSITDFYEVREMFDGNENAWPPLRRRERMAEAIYE
jgi:hypothetical protein